MHCAIRQSPITRKALLRDVVNLLYRDYFCPAKPRQGKGGFGFPKNHTRSNRLKRNGVRQIFQG